MLDDGDWNEMQGDKEMLEIYSSIYYTSSEEYPNQWVDEETLSYNYGLNKEDQ